VTYATIIDVDNADLMLKPGMTSNVSIIITRKSDIVTVSNAALRFEPPGEKKEAADEPRDERPRPARRAAIERPTGSAEAKNDDRKKRTVYFTQPAPDEKTSPILIPVEIEVGITDGIRTEVLTGLVTGQSVVTGIIPPEDGDKKNNTFSGSPFGSGMPRRM
jgi:HlyD family secretion protein